MWTISPYSDDRFDDVVDFVTRLNDNPADHIAFYGYGRVEIEHSLRDMPLSLEETFRLADQDGRLVGVMGVDYDTYVRHAWILGPLVEAPDWQALADELYEAVRPLIPDGLDDHKLFADAQNQRLDAFARRHGFAATSEDALMTLLRADAPRLGPSGSVTFDAAYAPQLEAVHAALFPNTYYTAGQLIDKQDDRHHLIMSADGPRLLGYAFYKVEPDAQQAYLDFIGVIDTARRQGIGRRLLADVISSSFADPAVQRLNLTVRANNEAAIDLYRTFGFTVERRVRAYRRALKP